MPPRPRHPPSLPPPQPRSGRRHPLHFARSVFHGGTVPPRRSPATRRTRATVGTGTNVESSRGSCWQSLTSVTPSNRELHRGGSARHPTGGGKIALDTELIFLYCHVRAISLGSNKRICRGAGSATARQPAGFIAQGRFAVTLQKTTLSICLVLLVCACSMAQTVTGSLVGLVVDPAGSVIPDVKIQLTNQGTSAPPSS